MSTPVHVGQVPTPETVAAEPVPAGTLPRPAVEKRHFALLLTGVLGICVLWLIVPFLSGIFGAAIFYVILVPAHRRLSHWIGGRASAVLLAVAMLLLVVAPGVALTTVVSNELPSVLQRALTSDVIGRLRTVSLGGYAVGTYLIQGINALIDKTPRQILGLFAHVTLALLNLVIALLGLYYLLVSSGSVWRRVREMLPYSDPHAERLRERFFSVTQSMVVGIVVVALVQGSIVGAGFSAVGLPYPLFWGIVTGVASIVPVLGTGLVWGPGVIVLMTQHRYGAAAVLLVIGAVVASNIDNVIRPIVYRKVSGLHPMTTLVGALAGVKFFGLVGVLLGPLAISLFFELVDMYHQEYGDGRRVPPAG